MSDIASIAPPELPLDEKIRRLELLHRVGILLSAERNRDRLVEKILVEAKHLCQADGGTLYLRTDDDHLGFAMRRTDSLGIALGGTTGKPIPFPRLPLYDKQGNPNHKNVATYAALEKKTVNIRDAYTEDGFDFSGTKAFDARNQYRSRSFLTIPMTNSEGRVLGVLQLINAKDESGKTVSFRRDYQEIVQALASQAAVALDNRLLLDAQKVLLESFIKLIASAIDSKSPYTGEHCERVPVLVQMLAEAAVAVQDGPFRDFTLNEEEWYELRIAAWLHDCGKVTTPVHVMDKATKLQTIFDRMHIVRARFEVLRREAEISRLERLLAGENPVAVQESYDTAIQKLQSDLAFLEKANVGGEFLAPDKQDRIRAIGKTPYRQNGKDETLLTEDEIANLVISRGTLNEEERIVINGHMVETIRMLEALPFPRNLRRVPEYAGGHHEKMDGKGYPKGLYAGDMSIPARLMAIADVFEALTAGDRPYKPGKTLSESMKIMGKMKKDNHLDPDLFDLFVTSGVYRSYAEKYLPPAAIDEVDEAALLAIRPETFELPLEEERKKRWASFLPSYQRLIPRDAR